MIHTPQPTASAADIMSRTITQSPAAVYCSGDTNVHIYASQLLWSVNFQTILVRRLVWLKNEIDKHNTRPSCRFTQEMFDDRCVILRQTREHMVHEAMDVQVVDHLMNEYRACGRREGWHCTGFVTGLTKDFPF